MLKLRLFELGNVSLVENFEEVVEPCVLAVPESGQHGLLEQLREVVDLV